MDKLKQAGYIFDRSGRYWAREAKREPFGYSDGDEVERRLAGIIEGAGDRTVDSTELASHIIDWPSLYYFSSKRSNLIWPVLERIEGPVLEIGAGLGTITRFLGERGLEVLALEGSVRRARTAAVRCSDLDNVTIVSDELARFDVAGPFQTVTLIGVLEYARAFHEKEAGRDAVDTMLAKARALLAPGGVLLLAIENQLGLKYLAGYPEDHLGVPMVGVEDRYEPRSVVTFGRRELRRRLAGAGFAHQDWWFPFPDYKLPTSILSERALAEDVDVDFSSVLSGSAHEDTQRPAFTCFSLQEAWKAVGRNQLFGDLANSFLVAASDAPFPPSDVLGHHFGSDRLRPLQKIVTFKQTPEGVKVVRTLRHAEVAGDPSEVRLHLDTEPFVPGRVWRDELPNLLLRPGWSLADVTGWAQVWWQAAMIHLGTTGIRPALAADSPVPGSAIDLTPRNLIVDDGQWRFIDQEWDLPHDIDLAHMMVRGLMDGLMIVEACARPAPGIPINVSQIVIAVSGDLGLRLTAEDIVSCVERENRFQEMVVGRAMLPDASKALTFELRERPSLIDLPVIAERLAEAQQARDRAESMVADTQSIADGLWLERLDRLKLVDKLQTSLEQKKRECEQAQALADDKRAIADAFWLERNARLDLITELEAALVKERLGRTEADQRAKQYGLDVEALQSEGRTLAAKLAGLEKQVVEDRAAVAAMQADRANALATIVRNKEEFDRARDEVLRLTHERAEREQHIEWLGWELQDSRKVTDRLWIERGQLLRAVEREKS